MNGNDVHKKTSWKHTGRVLLDLDIIYTNNYGASKLYIWLRK